MSANVPVEPFKQFWPRIATILACVLVIQSCRSDQTPDPATGTQTSPPPSATPQTPAGGVVPAPVVTQSSWSPDALEELLAPIALYPDQLLAQVLAASINAQEVLDGGNWLLQNQNLKGNDLDAAAQKVGFGTAMRALLLFPTVVDMMCQEIDWTRQVGSAFSSDQKSVLDAVQRLRKQAADVGNLKSTPQQVVSTKSEDGNVYVEVKPADPQVIYVPQYNPQEVYTTPPPEAATTTPVQTTTTQTVVVEDDDDDGSNALLGGLIGFGVGMLVGNAFNDDDYYYPHWGGGMYYGGRPFYPPAYAYRPAYGAGFRPAYGYAPPAGYRNNYNNIRSNNNIVVNNKNYYNRFDNNQNLRAGNARSPIAGSQRPGQRPGVDTRPATGSNWKGQSTYAGARKDGKGIRDQGSSSRPGAATREARAGSSSARPGAGTRDGASRVDRGIDKSARSRDSAAARPGAGTRDAASRADRGYDKSARMTARQEQGLSEPAARQRNSAFSGAESKGGGNFQRSASARGNASAGSRQTSSGGSRPSGGGGSRRR